MLEVSTMIDVLAHLCCQKNMIAIGVFFKILGDDVVVFLRADSVFSCH